MNAAKTRSRCTHGFHPSILCLKDKGILLGNNGDSKWNDPITRAEVLALFERLAKVGVKKATCHLNKAVIKKGLYGSPVYIVCNVMDGLNILISGGKQMRFIFTKEERVIYFLPSLSLCMCIVYRTRFRIIYGSTE